MSGNGTQRPTFGYRFVVPLPVVTAVVANLLPERRRREGRVRVRERQDRSGKAGRADGKFGVDSAQNRAIPQGTGLAVPNNQERAANGIQ